jgi:phosphoserine phosphatase RsbU/P
VIDQALFKRFFQVMATLTLLPIILLWAGAAAWLNEKAATALTGNAFGVALSVGATIEDALAFGQPLSELRGADQYFQRLLTDNAGIRFIAVIGPKRQLLFVQGIDREHFADELSTLTNEELETRSKPGEATRPIAVLPLRSGTSAVGSVLVSARPLDRLSVLTVGGLPLLAIPLAWLVVASTAAILSLSHVVFAPLSHLMGRFDAGANGEFDTGERFYGRDEIGGIGLVLALLLRLIRDRASHFNDYTDEVLSAVADPAVAEQVEYLRADAGRQIGEGLFGHPAGEIPSGGQEASLTGNKGSLLRARITLLVFFAIILISVGMALTGNYRVRLLEDNASASAVAAIDLSWRKLMNGAIAGLETDAAILLSIPNIAQAVERHDSQALAADMKKGATHLFDSTKPYTEVEITALDGGVLFGGSGIDGASLLGTFTLTTVVRTAAPVSGLAITPEHEIVTVFTRPILDGTRIIGTITLIRDAIPLLRELAGILGLDVYALELDGRLAYGDNAPVWEKLAPRVELGRRSLEYIAAGHATYAVSTMGLPTISAGRLGYLATVRDVTDQQIRSQRLQMAFYVLVAVMMGLAVMALYYYLCHVFAPLDAAIAALNTLSRGDTAVVLDTPASADEVGRIAAAVRVFRDRTRALLRLAEERSRRRRRQERLIRRQMLKLAETLQDGAREAVLKDLDKIEQEASLRASGADVAAELDALAIAFQTMAGRVHEQHRELDMLVAELREALKAKTAFIALQQELEIARELQLAILPKVSTDEDEFEAHAVMIPAKEVGGDFYDFFRLSQRRVGMVVADVSGKGVPAALFMAVSRTLLKATAVFRMAPGECLNKLNSLLAESNEKSLFVTVFYGILDLETGILTYANGGHNPPILLSADGTVTPLKGTDGIVLALEPDLTYDEATVEMQAGDTLVMYTDGVTEAMNLSTAMFGDALLAEKLGECAGLSAHDTTARVLDSVHEFSAGCPQTDDITCFAFRYKGAMPQVDTRVFTLRNDLQELPGLRAEIEIFLAAYDLSKDTVFNICLSLDEIFTNIVSYGYDDPSERKIEVIIRHDGNEVVATVIDDGKEYDPLADPFPPDLDSDLDTRSVGGLGIFLVRTFMDKVSYSRDGERNRLVIVKHIGGG